MKPPIAPTLKAGIAFGILPDLELSDEVREELRTDDGLERIIADAAKHHFAEKAARQRADEAERQGPPTREP